MSKNVALRLCVLFMLITVLAVTGVAQTTASIKGSVTDQSGAAVNGAKVTVKNTAKGIERTTQTNDSGDYEVPALPPGLYTVEVQGQGFQPQQVNNLTLQVAQNSVQNFNLRVANATEVVTVEASAPVIETTTMTVGQTINERTVQEIPLNGRHFVDLALLVPGSVTPPQNGFLTAPLRGQGSFAFNTAGSREDAVNFMINGINLNDMVQNQVTFQPTINTVAEFKVDNSTYSAEYGRNSGAIVNIATRSGTEQFHGEAYEYLRNNWFDARNAFNPITQPQAPFKRNQFGGDIGGPIHHGTTYFFLSYEGLRHRQGLTVAQQVLSDAQRATINATSSAQIKGLTSFIPAANGTLNGQPAFLGSVTAPVDIDQGTADISHKFSDNDMLHGYWVYQRDLRQETGSTGGTNLIGFGDIRNGHRQVLTVSETHTFTSSLVNELRLGANRIHLTFTPNNQTDPNSIGINLGANAPLGLPVIRISDIGALFGSERNFPQGRGDTMFVLGDTVSYIHGRHSFKFGTEWRDFRNDNFNNDPGTLVFNTTAHFISGTADTAQRTEGNVASRINQTALDFFGQDSFKLTSYLTFELGLRYAWNMTPSEAKGRFANFVPAISPTFDGAMIVPVEQPYNQNNKNFQPRVGFAWDLFHDGNTVLRGGYAYQVDQPITGIVTQLASNPPFAFPITVTGQNVTALAGFFNGAPANITPLMVNPDFKNADVQSWNLNLQHQLTKSTGFMIGYFGNKGTHLEIDRNVNQFTILGSAASRPFQKLSLNSPLLPGTTLGNSITERDSNSNSNYNALWVTANKRMSQGLQFNASYTWSHSIDDASRNNEGLIVQDNNNIFSSRGNSDFDVRHRFVVNAIYDLPFKGNRFVSGWELAPIVSAQTGNPFNVVLATTTVTGTGNTIRPNVTGPVIITGNPTQWIGNPGVFVNPGNAFGNLGRNALYGPGFADVDLSLIKNTKLTERLNMQIRADAFDLLNHPNYGMPAPQAGGASSLVFTSATTPGFSTINSTRFPTGDSGSARQLQFAMKLLF